MLRGRSHQAGTLKSIHAIAWAFVTPRRCGLGWNGDFGLLVLIEIGDCNIDGDIDNMLVQC